LNRYHIGQVIRRGAPREGQQAAQRVEKVPPLHLLIAGDGREVQPLVPGGQFAIVRLKGVDVGCPQSEAQRRGRCAQ